MLDLPGIRPHQSQVGREIRGEVDVLSDEAAEHLLGGLDDSVEVDDPGLEHLLARKGEQLSGETHRAVDSSPDLLHRSGRRITFRQPGLDELRVASDGGKKIVEVVGYAAGEEPDRLHLGGVAEPFLHALAIGDVEPRSDQLDRPPFVVLHQSGLVVYPAIAAVAREQAILVGSLPLPEDLGPAHQKVPVFGMHVVRPELGVAEDLLSRVAELRLKVLAHKGDREEIFRLTAVDDNGARGQQMSKPAPAARQLFVGRSQLSRPRLDTLIEFPVGLLQSYFRLSAVGRVAKNQDASAHAIVTVSEGGHSAFVETSSVLVLWRTLDGAASPIRMGGEETRAVRHYFGDGLARDRAKIFADQTSQPRD